MPGKRWRRKGGEISDIRNNSRAQINDTEREQPAKRLGEERMKEINETNTSPEEGGENARPGKKREEAKPEEEKSGKKKNKKRRVKITKKIHRARKLYQRRILKRVVN